MRNAIAGLVAAFWAAASASGVPVSDWKAQGGARVAAMPGGVLLVDTPVNSNSWPGVRIEYGEPQDFSRCDSIVLSVSNTLDIAQRVTCRVRSCAGKTGFEGSPCGTAELSPHATGRIDVVFRRTTWVLDRPIPFRGMYRLPKSSGDASRSIRSIHVFQGSRTEPGGWAILSAEIRMGDEARRVSADGFMPFVDRYGQFRHIDWPGKVHGDEELRRPDAPLPAHIPGRARWCRFGGCADGPAMKSTGHFRTQKVGGRWWLVDPCGHLFFSHGIAGIRCDNSTGVSGREEYFEWLPPKGDPDFGRFWGRCAKSFRSWYSEPGHAPFDVFNFAGANALRKYGKDWRSAVANAAHRRLHEWGFNTIGNWSDESITSLRRTPYCRWIEPRGRTIAASKGHMGGLVDPFSKEFDENLEKAVAREAAKTGKDEWCIGYFVDNELPWGKYGDETCIGQAVLDSPDDQPAKAAARERGLEDPASIQALVAETYFRKVAEALRRHAPAKLYLGSRFCNGGSNVWRAAARHCDVVSANIYSMTPMRDLPPGAEDRPMLVGEFHFGSLDAGAFGAGLVQVGSQEERGEAYRRYVRAALASRRYVGTHWFLWQDQALTARAMDGENYAIGFVSVADVPYASLVAASRAVAAELYRSVDGGGQSAASNASQDK